ncbi:unnamed protein product [Brassica oleracea var. botrytis]
MTRISDLSQDLIEEILSRVPLTSQRAATSTCKQWNGFYKDESFTKKHRGKAAHDTMEIMVYDSRVRLVRVHLQGGLSLRKLEMRPSLICFDFTSQRFRRCLDLDANSRSGDSVILSVVREEQLAVLFYRDAVILSTIQITTKIEAANEVTWTSFLKVDVKPLVEISWRFPPCGSFFVDKNKKVALIWDNYNCNRAYVIGEDNYFARVALGESQCWPLVCSYVPSSVQIQRGPVHAPGKRKVRDY